MKSCEFCSWKSPPVISTVPLNLTRPLPAMVSPFWNTNTSLVVLPIVPLADTLSRKHATVVLPAYPATGVKRFPVIA